VILVHATDRTFIDLARRFGLTGLRVAGARGRMFFAPGLDANPLVPGSNPKDIAVGIRTGDPRVRERHIEGLGTFVDALLLAGLVPDEQIGELVTTSLSGEVVFVALEGATVLEHPVRWRWRGDDQYDQVAIIDAVDAAALPYRILVEERHVARSGGYGFRREYDDGAIIEQGDTS
jgi:hypothetical protein